MDDNHAPVDPAARWAARRTDPTPLSDAESARYTAWLAADPENGRRLARFERVWRDARTGAAAANLVAAARRRGTGRRAALAGAAAASVAGAAWLARAPLGRSFADLSTPVGAVRSYTVEPGIRLTLDTATAVDRDGPGAWRLLEGAVRVDAERDSRFTLAGPGATVVATGASLVLRTGGRGDRLAVVLGRAAAAGAVVAAGSGATFVSGEPARVEPLGAIERDEAEGFSEAWRRYEDAPLAAVIGDLRRYRTAPIWLGGEAGSLRVTGRFRFLDPERVIAGLSVTLPIQVQRFGPVLRIFRA